MKIWALTICHNEENFIWFALMSVVDHVDKILVWDTGSTDRTVEIIKLAQAKFPQKIEFRECGDWALTGFGKFRQQMLEAAKCDWVVILDGDEVWWRDSIKRLVKLIEHKGTRLSAIAVPFRVPVGDIFHFQSELAGRYRIQGRQGHLTVRAINRKLAGLKISGEYPHEGFVDGKGRLIQDRSDIEYLDAPYLHLTHLRRSSRPQRDNKIKLELGSYAGNNFKFPEVFYLDYPEIVPSPWTKIGLFESVRASIMTGLRNIKRRIS